eukprot:TRINITY_DN40932_c0_g1_i1.p1 TRINITY_DN40932_c0_g1~~TRINITY_DN40932_c0_g1_i1.p1  ORF type:complete len:166 (-),score=31.00 TRINITY_DN40932_c0_g1_i1:15-512(-)
MNASVLFLLACLLLFVQAQDGDASSVVISDDGKAPLDVINKRAANAVLNEAEVYVVLFFKSKHAPSDSLRRNAWSQLTRQYFGRARFAEVNLATKGGRDFAAKQLVTNEIPVIQVIAGVDPVTVALPDPGISVEDLAATVFAPLEGYTQSAEGTFLKKRPSADDL